MKNLNQFMTSPDSRGLRLAIREARRLADAIRAALPVDLADHIVGCVPRDDTVVVLVDSAAWASQLRYARQAILQASRDFLDPRIRNVQFRITPAVRPGPTKNPAAPAISDTTRQLLQQAAAGIDDEELANALRRLGRPADQEAD